MRKKLSIALAVLVSFVILLSACSSGGNSGAGSTSVAKQDAGSSAPADASTNLTAFVAVSASLIDIATNEFILWAEEQTGVHVDFRTALEEDEFGDQINLLLASGAALPDMIIGEFIFEEPNHIQLVRYGGEGIIIPINDLIEEYGVNAKAFIKEFTGSDDFSAITAPDGNIYAMPSGEACYHCTYSQKMWINQTWLNNLNLSMPTTTDEFYQVLKAFKEQDPNGNGIADEIPLSGCTEWWHSEPINFIMNAFTYFDDNAYLAIDDSDVVSAAFTKPEWKEGLAYLNKLYSEGLLDSEAFVQKPDQTRQFVENGEAIMLGAMPTGTPAAFADDTGEATKNYVTVPPLTGPKGFRTTGYYPAELGLNGMVTKDCKDPAAAVKWMDFLLSEEATMRQVFGVEGVDWVKADEGAVGSGGNPAILKEINILPGMNEQNQGIELLAAMTQRLFDGRQIDPDDIWYIERRLVEETTKNYDIGVAPKKVVQKPFMSIEDATLVDELWMPLRDHVKSNAAQFVTGVRDIETEWDAYLAELEQIGAAEYVALYQKYYK